MNQLPDPLHLTLQICAGMPEITNTVAHLLEKLCVDALSRQGFFTLGLSGGSTPLALFRLLRLPEWQVRIDWSRTQLFWVDERCVPVDHPQSNAGNAYRELLAHIPVGVVNRIQGELPPAQAASSYERLIKAQVPAERGIPRFDCLLLGMGDDGHTASLFPQTPELPEHKLIAATRAPHAGEAPERNRITMTLPLINAARTCIIMAAGTQKQVPLHRALNLLAPAQLPIQRVRPLHGDLVWIVDQAATAERPAQPQPPKSL